MYLYVCLVVVGNKALASSLITVTASTQNTSAPPDADAASQQTNKFKRVATDSRGKLTNVNRHSLKHMEGRLTRPGETNQGGKRAKTKG